MNILFLDIDGVLNSHLQVRYRNKILEHNCILRLKKILYSVPNTKIVVTSAWRYSEMRMIFLKITFKKYGINLNYLLDETPKYLMLKRFQHKSFEQIRKLEIDTWVNRNSKRINNWIVIDDMFMNFDKKHYVQTDCNIGLTDNDTKKIIKLLKYKEKWYYFWIYCC